MVEGFLMRLPYRKTFLWFAVALTVALIATGIWLTGEWTSYKNPPSIYGKIGLGDSREEVRYKLGDPPEVDDDVPNAQGAVRVYATNREGPINAMRADKTVNQFNTWQ